MWGHPIFLIGFGVAAVITIVAKAYTHYRELQQGVQYDETLSEPSFNSRLMGLCSECDYNVFSLNGYETPCNHYVHFTCALNVSKEFQGIRNIEWKQVCKRCLGERINANKKEQQDIRLRKKPLHECANCRRPFEFEEVNLVDLKCGHRVHEECWARMQNSGSPTCPMCMDIEEP